MFWGGLAGGLFLAASLPDSKTVMKLKTVREMSEARAVGSSTLDLAIVKDIKQRFGARMFSDHAHVLLRFKLCVPFDKTFA